jgi:hypothetical protein
VELPKNATENSDVTVKAMDTKSCRSSVTGNWMTGADTRGIPPATMTFKVLEHRNWSLLNGYISQIKMQHNESLKNAKATFDYVRRLFPL